ncbi:MAG: hypothetical protein AB1Z98_28500 [Nannocystaceae bacterium]
MSTLAVSVSAVEQLESMLVELDVSPAELRRDPQGRSWLPAQARALVEAEPACAAMLRDFVDDELALLGALEDRSVVPSADPFFTARVVDSLPPQAWAPNRLTPRRRLLVLGVFHLVAVMLALVVLSMVPESTARWAEGAHSVLRWGSQAGSSLWLTASAIAAVAVVALVAARSHDTPAT